MGIMDQANAAMEVINGILWHDSVLYILLGTGVLFTIWSGFSQWHSLTHGVDVIRGKFDKKGDPGAINHFQALSAALSATVGLGNIGGVAIAIALGGPGAVFWMWVVGLVGMALKTTEVTQSMLYRNTDDKDDPHGGPMWVVGKGLNHISPALKRLGHVIGVIFCITLLISTATGGNMFQAWNVGELYSNYFGIPEIVTGIILAVVVGAVIIGGIKRIGAVAGRLVPFMCLIYVLAAGYVLIVQFDQIPGLLRMIVTYAFSPSEAQGAFLGGTMGIAMMWGMKRALFSSEAGQGSAPIAHSAAKTGEPVREGVVAGLEPFIDTIIVCTLTSLVILSSGAWNRGPEAVFVQPPEVVNTEDGKWTLNSSALPERDELHQEISGEWQESDVVFAILEVGEQTLRLNGTVENKNSEFMIRWDSLASDTKPTLREPGIYADYSAAALTSYSFDRVMPGLGKWLVPLVALLFAISTMISWSYYGEQGMIYMFGKRSVLPYKVVYCLLIILACSGIITTTTELDNLTGLGTGIMLFANIPIMLIFGSQAMRAYKDYMKKLKAGKFKEHDASSITDIVEDKD